MARLGDRDTPGARAVTVLDDDEAVADAVADDLFGDGRHGPARLAAAQDVDARAAGKIEAKMAPDERRHIAGGERRVEDRARRVARGHERSLRRRSPASRSMSSVFGKQNRILVRPSSGWA